MSPTAHPLLGHGHHLCVVAQGAPPGTLPPLPDAETLPPVR